MTESVQPRVVCEMVTKYFSQIVMNVSLIYAIIAMKHYFQYINVCQVPQAGEVKNLGLHPRVLTSPLGPGVR